MDKRKILIFLIIFIIIVILLLLLALININTGNTNTNHYIGNQNNSNVTNENIANDTRSEPSNEISQSDEVKLDTTTNYFDVKINSVYFTIRDKANDFFKIVNLLEDDSNATKLYNLLGKEYINKNNITKQNLKTNFSKYIDSKFYVEKITEKIIENNICIFMVNGSINEKEKYNMAIVTDENKLSYCIYPYEYLKENNIDNLKISSIAENNYNKLEYKDVNQETLAQYHFADLQYYAQNNPEKLYNKLDSAYSKKKFNSLNEFKQYINRNIDTIKNSSLVSYKITRNEDTVEYKCIDNYNNVYTFQETSTMQYKVFLDNYTIMFKDDIEYYNDLDKLGKARYNLTLFTNMLNTKDYKSIYNVLDNTFKINNFKSISELEKYIKNNLYSINTIKINDFDDSYGYYVFECKVKNSEDTNKSKDMTIIIKLNEGTNFTMSFSFAKEK